jgi:Rieske Fe-S protein
VATGNDSPHVPPPSLWPVGFALGVVCLLVGVVVSWWAAAVGAAVAIVFAALWVRDLMGAKARAAAPAPADEGDRIEAPPLPANEGGDAMPKPSAGEIERFPRSKFLEGATLGVGALIGGAVTVPAVGLMVVPAFTKQGRDDVDVGPLSDYPEGEWVVTTFLLSPEEGEVSRRTAYIRNNGVVDGVPSFTIMSNRCAHLGCPVQANALLQEDKAKDETTDQKNTIRIIPTVGLSGFGCPCHGGAYDTEGNRTAGPPVRGLDRYEFSIVNGRLFLGKTYSVNVVKGTGADARIQKFELAGPGQHVSGIEGWLYPLQPPHG